MTDAPSPTPVPLSQASLELRAGAFELKMHVEVTPGALLAIGGLVGSILLSTSVLVWTATSVRRRHPIAAGLIR